ncbi:MAG: type II toxin-antitoxin system HicB family antitoxin [Thiobacillus sp.]
MMKPRRLLPRCWNCLAAWRTAHGDTQEEALAKAKEAMRLWLDTAHEFGDPVPEPRRRLMYA